MESGQLESLSDLDWANQPKYKIISSDDIDVLEKLVIVHLDHGYDLLGQPFSFEDSDLVCQTVVRPSVGVRS